MIPIWSNNTCPPNTATGQPGPPEGCPDECLQGFLSLHAILAKKPADIQAGVNFARKKNMRIIIRNSGHCFMGRSTGTVSSGKGVDGMKLHANMDIRIRCSRDQYPSIEFD